MRLFTFFAAERQGKFDSRSLPLNTELQRLVPAAELAD